MATRTYRIRGTLVDEEAPVPASANITSHRRLIPGRARDGVTGEEEVSSDTLVRVELNNGFVHWGRFDDLVRDYGVQAVSRDGADVWEIDNLAPPLRPARERDERGLFGLAIKVLDLFGFKLEQTAAGTLGSMGEKMQLKGNEPGLYRCTLSDKFSLKPVGARETIAAKDGPILVFIHGTASSCQGSFGKLWEDKNRSGRDARERLAGIYGERVFAFEHRSLTRSPIDNALELAERLPKGGEIHLVSHSRGGLVGELLCLGGCQDLQDKLTAESIEKYFKPDEILWQQLGLSPLGDKAEAEHDMAYKADRAALLKLVGLLKGRFGVKRFVRVACPARGTTLASGRLDRWLSMLSFLMERATGGGLVSDGVDFLFSVVKQRTDPRILPGLEAMMPGSALTRLLQDQTFETGSDLSVISGDLEGKTLLERLSLKQLVADWFYSADNDLVVNTGSMSGGLKRAKGRARFCKASGPDVDHFSYFENRESIQWLVSGLARADDDMGLFSPLEEAQRERPRWRDAVAASRAVSKPRPLALVLPGTMGSELQVDDDLIWLDYFSLFKGGLKKLRNRANDRVSTTDSVIDEYYGPLLEFLSRTHHVEVMPYDWRHSVFAAAKSLMKRLDEWLPLAEKNQQPVHLVAHSMGGLVVRAMIADRQGNKLWQRISQLPNSRFLMLGTPNLGSYEAVRWLTGTNPTQAKLSLLDITQNTKEIVDLVREFPGLLELLPFAEGDEDFSNPALWQGIKKILRAHWKTAQESRLRKVAESWQKLRASPLDPQRMCYVAGCQPATVIGYQFSDYYESWLSGRKRLEFLATTEGDGTVAWSSGRLQGIRTWYVEDTAHDALCAKKGAFSGYLDLLMTGATGRLPETPPATTRDTHRAGKTFVLPQSPPIDAIPSARDLSGFGFGGGVAVEELDQQPAAPTIEVSIRHGDLSYARHPVLVGHYLGDSILSAEAVLDLRLKGALRRRLELGLYPGPLNSHRIFFHDEPDGKPGGAIVVGLGQVGELTRGLLQSGVTSALLDYALQISQWPDDRFGEPGTPRTASVSCLLVGTSSGGMTPGESVDAILRGAVDANEQLMRVDLDNRVTIDRLEFLDYYEDLALLAAEALRSVLLDGELASIVRWPDQVVNAGQAGRRRLYFDESPGWWHRLEISEDENLPDTLRFSFSTDRARSEETLSSGQLKLADAFIASASSTARSNREAARTLYEMLLPVRVREQAPRQTDLVLLVDRYSARYPWELLEDRWSRDDRPPAVRAGLIRQLKTPEFRQRPIHTVQARVLVVGNPDLDGWHRFSDLPGARNEALHVARQLSDGGFQVTDCIDQTTDVILEALHKDAWRILHLSGHGVHDFELDEVEPETLEERCNKLAQKKRRHKLSGMVIGRDTILTPGDVEQMRWVPEIVFINCCHLGKSEGERSLDRGGLAANLGIQFIRMGVRAVVAAGWAVDDQAARVFAETFYRHMLDGAGFGEAVRRAREEALLRYPNTNTWGAYQCYGDHSYRLKRDGRSNRREWPAFSSPIEIQVELENLANALKVGGESLEQEIDERIDGILKRVPETKREEWLKRADLAAALGLVWGEARRWPEAIEWSEKALLGAKGDCPIRVVEQCANYKVRQAADDWLANRERPEAQREPRRQEYLDIIESSILEMDLLCQRAATEERLNLLGSACKRLSMVQNLPEQRKEALANMANYYQQSIDLGGGGKPYPFTNWASAQLLLSRLDKELKPVDASGLFAETERLQERLRASLAREPNFWDSASLADIDLVRLLARCEGTSEPDRECLELVERIIDTYGNAIRRGASPREIASVVENLEFLLELVEPDAPLHHSLRRIMGTLR